MLHIAGLAMGIIAIIFGIIVMIHPKILAYLLGIYLILTGALAVIAAI
jgi:uncharacterized membrane protein HdeD (DUF308 family)